MRGRFICIEGGEGTGKTAISGLLANYLIKQGRNVDVVADPGSAPLSQELRKIVINKSIPCNPLQQAMLYLTARSALAEELKVMLNDGHDVICGRWTLSTMVYQGVCQGVPLVLIEELTKTLVDLTPDIYILLDCPPEIAVERKRIADPQAFAQDRFDSRGMDWHNKIRDAYKRFAAQYNYLCVDASRPLPEVQQDVIKLCSNWT